MITEMSYFCSHSCVIAHSYLLQRQFEFSVWMSNYIPYEIMDVITYCSWTKYGMIALM